MEFKYTRHQVARSARPDAEAFNRMYLIKNVSKLRATYQIRLLSFKAVEDGTTLVIRVPSSCEFDGSLRKLMKLCKKSIVREDF
jgi:hypothetical protein